MREATAVLTGVTKRYGRADAVSDVSFSLQPGQTIALVGHNGAGKTTLIKLMLGLIRPSGGTIRVLGEVPGSSGSRSRRQVGFLPENVAFHPSLTARELLRFYARLKSEPRERVEELLDRVGLLDAAGRAVRTYSKGMRQRLGLAQALLGRPRLLLLDEPTTGLDPSLRQSFYRTVQELAREGVTVLLSSHALTELEERAQRVIIMHSGRLIADGTVADLRRLSDLPVRMRLRMKDGQSAAAFNGFPSLTRVTPLEGAIDLECPEHEKMAVIRRIGAMGDAVSDVEIASPSLDDLYAHFLTSGEVRA